MADHFDEEESCGSGGLADGFRLPEFFGFNVEDVVAEVLFGDGCRIAGTEFVNQAHLAVIRMTGARGVESQREKPGELLHGWIGMAVIIDGIALRASGDGSVFGWPLLVSSLVSPGW